MSVPVLLRALFVHSYHFSSFPNKKYTEIEQETKNLHFTLFPKYINPVSIYLLIDWITMESGHKNIHGVLGTMQKRRGPRASPFLCSLEENAIMFFKAYEDLPRS